MYRPCYSTDFSISLASRQLGADINEERNKVELFERTGFHSVTCVNGHGEQKIEWRIRGREEENSF
jgi:hypothetical protein